MASIAYVTIAVFGLFHPRELSIEPWQTTHLELTCGGTTKRTLEGRSRIALQAGCETSPGDFILSIPNKIRRHYRGALSVKISNHELIPVITMTLEDAVARGRTITWKLGRRGALQLSGYESFRSVVSRPAFRPSVPFRCLHRDIR